ncbi:MAG: hypothetical protein IJA07_05695 [Agathobacter sp.]|nr:hypothetical protein [Agathobacter sp.]
MKIDINAPITGKKKDVYPSKKTINLYYKEDKTTRPSTIALYALFIVVVLLAVSKVVVFDRLDELAKVERQAKEMQAHYDEQMAKLKEYKDISSQYSRYSFSYLREDEILCDRMDVLDMLEKTVFAYSDVGSVSVTEDAVSINFTGTDLEETAKLVQLVESYDIVARVEVNTATLNEEYATRMVITLAGAEDGGEQ